ILGGVTITRALGGPRGHIPVKGRLWMSWVFILDFEHRPVDPVLLGAARRLFSRGQAAVWRRYPFALILKRAVADARPQPLLLKREPARRPTGLALLTKPELATSTPAPPATSAQPVAERAAARACVVWAGELTHRGHAVHAALLARRAVRRARRAR